MQKGFVKKIAIFGAGNRSQLCKKLAQAADIKIEVYFDNNQGLWNTKIDGISVTEPRKIDGLLYVVTVWGHEQEIISQLVRLGVDPDWIVTLNYFLLNCISEESVKYVAQQSMLALSEKPNTIQFPITHHCNFDCVMCGVGQQPHAVDIAPEKIQSILSDEYFSMINNVGINGGEPFIREDIIECVNAILCALPNVKQLSFISNGYFTEKIVNKLSNLKEICSKRGVKINISFSVDGYKEIQDFHRGKKGAFEHIENTLKTLLADKEKYADYINVICTITKYNIVKINEVEVWAENLGIDVAYNIATDNKRIDNLSKMEKCSVLTDEISRMLAQEFFYKKYLETKSERYYALFLFLKNGIRYSDCPCMHNEWITVLPDGNIGFCAPCSPELGALDGKNAAFIVNDHLNELRKIKEKCCMKCAQYSYSLNPEGMVLLLKDSMSNQIFRQDLT